MKITDVTLTDLREQYDLGVQIRDKLSEANEAVISPTGDVAQARVIRSKPLLDEAALAAVKQWRYTPTLLGGVPTPVILTVTVTFSLK